MYQSNQHTDRSQLFRNAINHSTWRCGLRLPALAFVVGWLAISPPARAVCREGCTEVGGTFLGDDATTGHYETAIGSLALHLRVYRVGNTANGAGALYSDTLRGDRNVASGVSALSGNTTGIDNTANGANALSGNTTGNRNVAVGCNALLINQTGSFNTAVGFQTLYQNTGSNNIALGFNAGNGLTEASGNICIGYGVLGMAGESNTTRISNTYSSVASARLVYINSDNKIGTLVSSRRFKEEIKPMGEASETIMALKPVTFHYKKEIEPNGGIMFGLVAEDVEKADPDLITRNEKGEPETVRYEAVNAMLLNQFLKQHRTVEEQDRVMEEQDRTIAKHQAEIRGLASQLQKVSNELASASPRGGLEVTDNRPQMTGSNH